MRNMHAVLVAAMGATAAFAFVTEAEAQTRRDRGTVVRSVTAPPLTIRQRPFTDSGPVVPPRSMHNYVSTVTIWAKPAWWDQRGLFGGETLPTPFDPPGRPSPLFEF